MQDIDVFTTCPQSKDVDRGDYVKRIIEVSRWSEDCGCRGILVYTDNGLVDPWLASQIILQNTQNLCPLVAVQPIYMHPYTAAKMIASYAYLHDRRICLNMLAGGFKNDLVALNDTTPHDDRYVRTTEYTLILKQLLASPRPVTFEGKYYSVKNLRMTPPLPEELFPDILISGSSEAGMAAAAAIGATAIVYPRRVEDYEAEEDSGPVRRGARIGIIAREDGDEAWRIAHARFPADRQGELTHQLAMKVSDSVWHKQLSEIQPDVPDSPYWTGPFLTYKTFCPYLVGSYDRTAQEVARYMAKGYRTFILDIPPSRDELEHTRIVFRKALALGG